jgi:hypothetical protein
MPNGEYARSRSLYTWKDKDWAVRAWNLEPHKYLYKVEVEVRNVVHEGDVNHYSDIVDALGVGLPAEAFIARYVNSAPQSGNHLKDQVEVLVIEAMVLERYDPPARQI